MNDAPTYRLLEIGEERQPGDELVLVDTDGRVYYWPWDGRFDSPVQGPRCKPARRKKCQP